MEKNLNHIHNCGFISMNLCEGMDVPKRNEAGEERVGPLKKYSEDRQMWQCT